jgi:hypothetical protein
MAQPNHTKALPDHYQAAPSHSPGYAPPAQAAGNSRPNLAPSQARGLSPSRPPNLNPSPIPNLNPSPLPNLNHSPIVLTLPHHICIPAGRGIFLRGGSSGSPSTRPTDTGDPTDPNRFRDRSGQDVIAVDQYHSTGQPASIGAGNAAAVPYPWDAANSQFGLLGVWAGADAGIDVPSSYWQAVQYHWLKEETEFGTWSASNQLCEPSIGPTWAGDWSLLVVHDELGLSQRSDELGRQPYHPGLIQAFKWLETGDNSTTIKDEQTNFVGYNLFMLERIGQASGFKYFGTHDWYRELAARVIPSQWPNGAFGRSPDGYDAVVQTAYTLIFLASGRHPIFMEKLFFDGAWANRPRDLANLTRFASRELERKLNWEVVPLSRDWTDWLDAPVLYIASHQAPPFGDSDFSKLRSYAQAGGMLFTHADGASKPFNDFVESTLAPTLFPNDKMQDIPADDPIYSIQYKIDPSLAKLRGVRNGSRWVLVHSPIDLAASWQTRGEKQSRKTFELGVNIFRCAAGNKGLHNRLAKPAIQVADDAPKVK